MKVGIVFVWIFCMIGFIHAQSNNIYSNITDEIVSKLQPYNVKYEESSHSLKFVDHYKNFQMSVPDHLHDNLPKILKVLIEYKDYIKKITILGYSSSRNSQGKTKEEKYLKNLVISQKRADNVLKYIKGLSTQLSLHDVDWIEKNFFSIGKSSSDVIKNEQGEEVESLSRRVEIQIQLQTNLKQRENKVISLAFYVQKLLKDYPSIKEKYYLIQSLQQELRQSKSTDYPTLDLNYNYTDYSKSDDDHYDLVKALDLTMRYNLFNGFKDLRQKNIDTYNIESNKYLKKQVESDLIQIFIESYLSIQQKKEVLDLAYNNLDNYKIWMDKEDIKFQNGLATFHNYSQVQGRYIQQKINLEEAKTAYKQSIIKMQKYIEFYSDDTNYFEKLNPSSKYFINKTVAFDDMLKKAPSIKEANANISMYKQKCEQSKSAYYPKVDLVGKTKITDEDYNNYLAPKNNVKESYVALEASFNLFSGGKDMANYKKTLFEYKQKLQKKQEIQRDLSYKLKTSYNQFDLEKTKQIYLKKLVEKREDSYLGAKYDYKFAKIDAKALLDAVDELYSAKKQQIENRYQLQTTKYEILGEIGVLKETILKNTNSKE